MEAAPLTDLADDRWKAAVGDLDRLPALATDDMVVVLVRLTRDIGVLPAGQVDALQSTLLGQHVERPEDRRAADADVARPSVGDQVCRGEMAAASSHERGNGAPRTGRAPT